MAELVYFPMPLQADEYDNANAQRTRRLFEWVAGVLERLGLVDAVSQAEAIEELRGITLDEEAVALAIRDASYPAIDDRQEHFCGLANRVGSSIITGNHHAISNDAAKDAKPRLAARRLRAGFRASQPIESSQVCRCAGCGEAVRHGR
jgi:hypothetical protein